MANLRLFPVVILGAMLLAGCTHTRQVGISERADTSFDALHQTLEGRRVDIELRDQRRMASTALRIRPDTTWSIDLLNNRLRTAPTSEIEAVTYTRYGKGAVEGAMLGAAGGALVGLAAGLALTSVREEDEARTSVGYYVSVPTVFFTILGIGTGTVLGINKGSRDRYEYPQVGNFMPMTQTEQEQPPEQTAVAPRLRRHD